MSLLQIELDEDLKDHRDKCRCCFKDLRDFVKVKKIDDEIRNLFCEVTQIPLIDSRELSTLICQTCYQDLHKLRDLRLKFVEKQSKLYDFVKKGILDPDEVRATVKVEVQEDDEEFLVEYENNELSLEDSKFLFNSQNYDEEEDESVSHKYFCDLCDWSGRLKKGLEQHIRTHAPRKKYNKPNQTYFCEMCAMTFDKKFHLNTHKRRQHTERVRNHICGVCGKGFFSLENLKKHVESHNQKQLPCEYCGKLFSCINNLRTHLYYHAEPKFICTVEGCDKKFFMRKRLRAHLKTHNGQKDFLCNYCDKSYFAQNDLNRHIFSIHQKLRFFCDEPGCQGNFSRREYYKKHALTHHANLSPEEMEILLQKIKDAIPLQRL